MYGVLPVLRYLRCRGSFGFSGEVSGSSPWVTSRNPGRLCPCSVHHWKVFATQKVQRAVCLLRPRGKAADTARRRSCHQGHQCDEHGLEYILAFYIGNRACLAQRVQELPTRGPCFQRPYKVWLWEPDMDLLGSVSGWL